MIKKIILITVLIFSAQAALAQTVRHTRKEPNFFVPQQTLDKMYRPEKLPPVEKMQINGKPAPVVQEMRQRAEAEAQKKRAAQAEAEKKRLEQIAALNQKKAEAEKKRAELLAKQQKAEQQKRQAEQQLPAVKVYSGKPDKSAAENNLPKPKPQGKRSKIATPDQPPQPFVTKTLAKAPSAPSPTPEISNAYSFSYDDIIAEYKRDVANISKNIPFDNPRLKSVIQDYKNLERKI
jgi:hypothetical protein